MNEELQTVNHELTAKVDELSRSNNDMKNLLNSTDIATLFLDGGLLVRRFTTQTAKLINLIPTDAGRPITDVTTELDYPDLADDAREVLRTLVFKEKQVASRDGRWFAVRILPYRTLENVIDGVVITFTEATRTKRLETALREQANQLQQMTESLPNLVWACRPDGACDYLSRQWLEYAGVPEAEQLGYGWLDRLHPDDRERVREQWREAIKSGQAINTEFRIRAAAGEYRWFTVRSVPIRDEQHHIVKWYATATDIDDLKRAVERLASVLEGIDEAFVDLDAALAITHLNSSAEQLLGRKRDALLGKRLLEILQPGTRSLLDEKLRQAVEQQRTLTFDAQLGDAPRCAQYSIRLYPHAPGISVFFRRALATGSPHPADS